MFPYLDLVGFRLRATIPQADVDNFETQFPGWIAQNLRSWSSWLNTRLRKRYGAAAEGNSLPMGQQPPTLVPAGTAPPAVTLTGRPTIGSMQLVITITTQGALGVAAFAWSKDNGVTSTTNVLTAAAVPLPGTGLVAAFGAGNYALDDVYTAETPVPEIVLTWLTVLTTWDFYMKRGRNPQNPEMLDLKARLDQVIAEVREAADGKDGLLDIPVNEDRDTAITTGGPLGYSEQSPFVWTDLQAQQAAVDDSRGSGS